MNTIQRQIGWGILVAIFVFALLTLSFIIAFPFVSLKELWDRDLMDIPFILFVPSVSLAVGLIFGIISGMYWKKQFQTVNQFLHDVEEGRPLEIDETGMFDDMTALLGRTKKIQKQMVEQVKLSQKLANEKAEDQEKRIQEIVSEERNRLARELHDSVSQQLFAASMLMSAINETDERENKQLKMVEAMIHQSQLEMRALLLHLRPAALKGKTLQEGMKELLIELSQKVTMEINWKIEEFPLDKGVEDHLFRILQESVSNTLRHSKANELEVLLIKRDDFTILRVVDDGVGFDVDESKAGSYGMQNMYERAIEIGGTIKIISVKNKGTRLEVKVPIMNHNTDEAK